MNVTGSPRSRMVRISATESARDLLEFVIVTPPPAGLSRALVFGRKRRPDRNTATVRLIIAPRLLATQRPGACSSDKGHLTTTSG
jgi:hypothetical protein